LQDIYKLAGELFNDYWKEFRKTVPANELRCARFWCNHGFCGGVVEPYNDTEVHLIKDYPLSLKYYTNARKEGIKHGIKSIL